MMTQEEIFERIRDVLSETFEIAPEKITIQPKLLEDLDIDSIDAIDLLVQLRPMLGNASIDSKYFHNMRTIEDVVVGLEKLINGSTDNTKAS